MTNPRYIIIYILSILNLFSCRDQNESPTQAIAFQKSKAISEKGDYISWKEHIIDDTELSGGVLSGSDGLVIADLDQDGYDDIVSVHEADIEYDTFPIGLIRIAYGSSNPDQWELVTLADGRDAAGAEDVAIADVNQDGFLDIVAACEKAHLIYFQNPGKEIRSTEWERLIPKATRGRGSYIRVFTADLNKDGKVEIIAANKGDQWGDGSKTIDPDSIPKHAISYFEIKGNPLENDSWVESELIRVVVPINSEPIDIDKDGDIDIIGGSRGELRIVLFENISQGDSIKFKTHPINAVGSTFPDSISNGKSLVTGFNMDYADLNQDGRLDIILAEAFRNLVWLEQPSDWSDEWKLHIIGYYIPDQLVGILASDINNDGKIDILTGGYSRGARDKDGDIEITTSMGRLAWFEQGEDPHKNWERHDFSRRIRGMYDKFIAKDMDHDGDIDFITTRGNSYPYDGVIWLEQVRSIDAKQVFTQARKEDSKEMGLPASSPNPDQ